MERGLFLSVLQGYIFCFFFYVYVSGTYDLTRVLYFFHTVCAPACDSCNGEDDMNHISHEQINDDTEEQTVKGFSRACPELIDYTGKVTDRYVSDY